MIYRPRAPCSRVVNAPSHWRPRSFHGIHERVVVVGIVMEDTAGGRLPAEPRALLPGGVAPAHLGPEFLVRVGGVVDHEVGAFDEPEDVGVGLARVMLGVGHVAHRAALGLDPVPGRTVRVVEGGRADGDAAVEGKLRRPRSSKPAGLRITSRDREHRLVHLA
jgi:hypothetical protein